MIPTPPTLHLREICRNSKANFSTSNTISTPDLRTSILRIARISAWPLLRNSIECLPSDCMFPLFYYRCLSDISFNVGFNNTISIRFSYAILRYCFLSLIIFKVNYFKFVSTTYPLRLSLFASLFQKITPKIFKSISRNFMIIFILLYFIFSFISPIFLFDSDFF